MDAMKTLKPLTTETQRHRESQNQKLSYDFFLPCIHEIGGAMKTAFEFQCSRAERRYSKNEVMKGFMFFSVSLCLCG
jgi:hypothetical protein